MSTGICPTCEQEVRLGPNEIHSCYNAKALRKYMASTQPCTVCEGRGYHYREQQFIGAMCDYCNGAGRVPLSTIQPTET